MSEEKKRKFLSLEQKFEVIEYNKRNSQLSSRELAAKFGVGRTQIQKILQNQKQLAKQYHDSVYGEGYVPPVTKFNPNLELNQKVYDWYKIEIVRTPTLSGTLIKQQAMAFAQQLNLSEFKASNGWLESFKRRHGIKLGKGHQQVEVKTEPNKRKSKEQKKQLAPSQSQEIKTNLGDNASVLNDDKLQMLIRQTINQVLSQQKIEVTNDGATVSKLPSPPPSPTRTLLATSKALQPPATIDPQLAVDGQLDQNVPGLNIWPPHTFTNEQHDTTAEITVALAELKQVKSLLVKHDLNDCIQHIDFIYDRLECLTHDQIASIENEEGAPDPEAHDPMAVEVPEEPVSEVLAAEHILAKQEQNVIEHVNATPAPKNVAKRKK